MSTLRTIMVGFGLSVLWALVGCHPGYKIEPQVLLRQLRIATTPDELRSWLKQAASLGPEKATNWAVPREAWPSWIPGIQSKHAFFGISVSVSVVSTNARMIWADGRGSCGLDLSLPAAVSQLPGTDFYVLEWEHGIYVWHSRRD
jgi:hypothetical protein